MNVGTPFTTELCDGTLCVLKEGGVGHATLHDAGVSAACQAACQALGGIVPLSALSVEKDALGKPWVRVVGAPTRVAISISHSAPWVLAVANATPILLGADVERIRTFAATTSDAFVTPAEKACIAQAPTRERDTLRTRVWSLKEATLKAFGVGLRVHPRDIEVAAALDGATPTTAITCRGTAYAATVLFPEVRPGYVAAVVAFSSSSGTLTPRWMFETSFLPSLRRPLISR